MLRAAGFELDVELTAAPVADGHMLADVPRIVRLTPEQRLQEVANVAQFAAAVRRG